MTFGSVAGGYDLKKTGAGTLNVGDLTTSPNVTVEGGTLNATSLVCNTLTIGTPSAMAVPEPARSFSSPVAAPAAGDSQTGEIVPRQDHAPAPAARRPARVFWCVRHDAQRHD